MAEPTFTLDQRQDLLRYRALRNQDVAGRVGATAGNVGQIIQGRDPTYEWSMPGADNLTAAERAQLAAKYAEILAKLAQAEREAVASDQDYASVGLTAQSTIIKALADVAGSQYAATANVADARIAAESKLADAANETITGARESLSLSPDGRSAVQDIAKQVSEDGLRNAPEVMVKINDAMQDLYKKNPAQIPAFVEEINRNMRATGRPELADFSLESALATGIGGAQFDTTLTNSLNDMMSRGLDAAAPLQDRMMRAEDDKTQALERMRKASAGASAPVKSLFDNLANYMSAAPGAERAYVEAPAADAPLEEKRAYVEKASQGQQTLDEQGSVVAKGAEGAAPAEGARPSPVVSYDAYAKANPRVDMTPVAAGGRSGTMPSGASYSMSGPTAETIKSLQALRGTIQTQMDNLEKTALSPLEAARGEAQQAAAAAMPEAFARAPGWATRAALRTAKAEERADVRALRAERDAAILRGETKAPLPEVGLAAVRQIPRTIGSLALAGVGAAAQGIMDRRARRQIGEGAMQPSAAPAEQPPAQPAEDPEALIQQAMGTLRDNDPEGLFDLAARIQGAATTPEQKRAAATYFRLAGNTARARSVEQEADDLEYEQTEAARAQRPDDTLDTRLRIPRVTTAAQRASARETLETDPSVRAMEDFQPNVPGRSPGTVAQVPDQPVRGRTLAQAKAEEPERWGTVGSLIGDLGTSRRLNESGEESGRVPFLRRPISTPPPRTPTGRVMPGESESTGGDERTGPAKMSEIGRILSEKPKSKASETRAAPEFQTDMAYWRQFQRRADALPTGDVGATQPGRPTQTPQGIDFSAGGTMEPQFETPQLRLLRRRSDTINGAVGQ